MQNYPDQLLSQAITNDIYATDGVAEDDIHDTNITIERNLALSNLSNIENNWVSNITNPDKDAITKLLRATIDPTNINIILNKLII